MIKAELKDKTTVINILSRAFDDNQSVNFIVCDDEKRDQRIKALMAYSWEVCLLFGEVWLSDDKRACALLLHSDQKRSSLKSICLDIRLIIQVIGFTKIGKILKREAQIKKIQPKEKSVYLWFIGVDPQYQNRGYGSSLLKNIILSSKQKLIILETSTLKNLPWYQKLGFQIYDQLDLGYTLYFLKRGPGN